MPHEITWCYLPSGSDKVPEESTLSFEGTQVSVQHSGGVG